MVHFFNFIISINSLYSLLIKVINPFSPALSLVKDSILKILLNSNFFSVSFFIHTILPSISKSIPFNSIALFFILLIFTKTISNFLYFFFLTFLISSSFSSFMFFFIFLLLFLYSSTFLFPCFPV